MNAMDSIAKVTGKAVATAFDLSSFKTACDLGGKEGTQRFKMVSLSNKPFFHISSFFVLFFQDALVPWPMSLLKPILGCL